MAGKAMLKIVTNILYPLLIIMLSAACLHAQQLSHTYPGTWHYDNGNQRFIVKMWQEQDYLRGHYKLVSVVNGEANSIIYDSRKEAETTDGIFFPPTIFGHADTQYKFSGTICDNTIIGYSHDCKRGELYIELNQFFPGCTTCIVTASWEVSEYEGMRVGEPVPFNIPTNITLTKVSDTVVWD